MNTVVYSTDTVAYNYFGSFSRERHNVRCIDGSITGCGKCVGYCKFNDHPGYLTKKMRQEHDCVKKGCHYYKSKNR